MHSVVGCIVDLVLASGAALHEYVGTTECHACRAVDKEASSRKKVHEVYRQAL
jgi:hypothetical protein